MNCLLLRALFIGSAVSLICVGESFCFQLVGEPVTSRRYQEYVDELFKAVDQDKDGQINQEEMEQKVHKFRLLGNADRNKDGQITRDEIVESLKSNRLQKEVQSAISDRIGRGGLTNANLSNKQLAKLLGRSSKESRAKRPLPETLQLKALLLHRGLSNQELNQNEGQANLSTVDQIAVSYTHLTLPTKA